MLIVKLQFEKILKKPPKEALVWFLSTFFGSISAVVLGIGMLLPSNPLLIGERLIHSSYDYLFYFKKPIKPDGVVMVYMDEESHRELNQPYDMGWDRAVHAQLLNKLTDDGVKAVAYDIVFSGAHPKNPNGDYEFAKAIKRNGKVILGAELMIDSVSGGSTFSRAYDPLFDAAACPLGIVQVYADQDFMVRKHLHVPPSPEEIEQSSLSWETARLVAVPITTNSAERFKDRWLNYYGPPGTIQWISFHSALNTPGGYFSNKVVFVGAFLKTVYSGQRKDEYITPYSGKGRFAPGVDIQATQFLNLYRGDWLERLGEKIEEIILIIFGIILGVYLIQLRPFNAIIFGVIFSGLVTVIAVYLFLYHRIWFPWIVMAAVQVPAATLWSWGYNSFRLYVQNRLLEQSLSAYVSPARVKQLLKQPDILQPGAEKQTLSILFSDIENFTHISEGMDSDELAQIMNDYFENGVAKIYETDGTVIKFIGDSIFAVWNAPLPQSDHAIRAAQSGLLLSKAVDTFIKSGKGPNLRTRIGLHTGVADVGNFGSKNRFDYTAIGESINLASRMEGLNKYLGTTLLATGELRNATNQEFIWRYLGRFKLKGFEKAVDVYELISEADKENSVDKWITDFEQAVRKFQSGQFEEAKKEFKNLLSQFPDDAPSHFYVKEIEELKKSALHIGWRGEIEIKEK